MLGHRVWSVGTPVAKGELYRWLKLEWPTEEALGAGASYPPGACHFPQYGEEYFKQITAECLVTRIVKGFPRGSWEKEPGRRNEALDCRAYARAAAAIYGLRPVRGTPLAEHGGSIGASWSRMIPSLSLRQLCRSSSCCTFGRTARNRHTGPWHAA
jgi:phage terminase large subunit GpA-like protein